MFYVALLSALFACAPTEPADLDGPPAGPGDDTEVGDTDAPAPAGPGILSEDAPDATYVIPSDDGDRTFEVVLPPDYDPEGSHPLVFFFHGGDGGGDGDSFISSFDIVSSSGIREAAGARGMVLIVPEALYGNWNDGRPDTDAALNGVDDVGFVDRLVGIALGDLAIDPNRVYGMGLSNGAQLTHLLACELEGRFAAMGPVAALRPDVLAGTCTHPSPVAWIQIQGGVDPLQPPTGGSGVFGDGTVTDIFETASERAALNGCTDVQGLDVLETWDLQTAPLVTEARARSCQGGADLDFYVVADLGHAWPPSNPDWEGPIVEMLTGGNSDAIDANQVILDFFEAHPRP